MPIPVIIDTDPGVDDAVAILYALSSPEIEIAAFIVSFGNTDVDASYNNIVKLYNALSLHFEQFPEHRARFPHFDSRPFIARGAAGPLEGPLHSAQYFHGRDGLGNISARCPDITTGRGESLLRAVLSDKPGHELALDVLRSYPPRTVTYIALGPLTNLALMARADPRACSERIDRVVCMGGALDVPGNTSAVAEFNFFADPFAVHELLTGADGRPSFPLERFVLLPLDITTPHELSFPLYASRVDPAFSTKDAIDSNSSNSSDAATNASVKSPLVHFTSAFLERTRDVMRLPEFGGKDGMELHDVVAVWYAVSNPPLGEQTLRSVDHRDGWKVHQRLFEIERKGELTCGMLVVDRRAEPGIYETGDSRSDVQAAVEKAVDDHNAPAPVMVENPETAKVPRGVFCVTQTPGREALVDSMISRIWGIDL